jgi:CheY-like chemotaxis protein
MKKILLVDDSFIARKGIRNLIRDLSFEIVEADGGAEALELIQTSRTDLVLLDLLMPDPDGFAVLRSLLQMKEAPPVIILSADIQITTQTKCYDLGAAAFLRKPPKKEQLIEAIREHIR